MMDWLAYMATSVIAHIIQFALLLVKFCDET